MKLWMVESRGWGWGFNLVRAETKDDAIRVAKERFGGCDVTELQDGDEEAILWSWDHSPDTPRDD